MSALGSFRRGVVLALCLTAVSVCNSESKDNFDRSGVPLKLLPAPGGLCGGDGAQKDCAEPGGCMTPDQDDEPGVPGANSPDFAADDAFDSDDDDTADDDTADDDTADDIFEPNGGAGAGSGPNTQMSDAGRKADAGPMSMPKDAGQMTPLDGGASVDAGSGFSDAGPIQSDAGMTSDAGAFEPAANGLSESSAFSQLQSKLSAACSNISREQTATLFLSADDSNSMASPVIARRLIRSGRVVPPRIVRAYEFLNYYDFRFEPAEKEEVRIVPQLSSCPVDGELNLQVALQSEKRSAGDRRPLNLTFVLDTSGSMEGTPMELMRAAVHAMAGRLKRGDVVSMVTWSVDQRVSLSGYAVTGKSDQVVLDAVDALVAGGGTDLSGGLSAGYSLAKEHRRDDRINRVVVISDGIANVGITDEQLIGRHADDEEGEEGIYLAGIGVGEGVNDTLMNTVTDAGRGAYIYLDSVAEAESMLGERFLEVVDVAARSVRLELTLPWYLQVAKFYGEEISTDPAKVRPQHLGPNSAMVFFQVLRACDESLIHGNDKIRLRATWTTPFNRQRKDAVIETTFNELAGDDRDIEKAAVIAGYAEALQRVGDASLEPGRAAGILQEALSDVREAPGAGVDPDLVEVAELLESYLQEFPQL